MVNSAQCHVAYAGKCDKHRKKGTISLLHNKIISQLRVRVLAWNTFRGSAERVVLGFYVEASKGRTPSNFKI